MVPLLWHIIMKHVDATPGEGHHMEQHWQRHKWCCCSSRLKKRSMPVVIRTNSLATEGR